MLGDTGIRWALPPLGVKAVGVAIATNHQTSRHQVMNTYEAVSRARTNSWSGRGRADEEIK